MGKFSKRLIAAALSALMALSVAACGSSSSGASGSAAASGSAGSGSASASNEQVKLKFSSMNPDSDNKYAVVMKAWFNYIKQQTNGNITFDEYYSSTAAEAADQLTAASTGIVDIGEVFSAYWGDSFPLWELFMLPFQYSFPDGYTFSHATVAMMEKYPEFIQEVEDQNVHFLMLHGDGVGQLFTKSKEIKSAADLKGLVINCGSNTDVELMTLLGASTEMMGAMEVYDNVSKGVLDGYCQCYTGSYVTGAIDAASYATEIDGAHQGWFFVMNNDTYNSLPEDYKQYFDEPSTKDFMYLLGYQFAQDELQTVNKISQNAKITVYKPTDAEKQTFIDASKPMAQEWIDKVTKQGFDGQSMYNDWVKLLAEYGTPDYSGCKDRLTELGATVPDGWQ